MGSCNQTEKSRQFRSSAGNSRKPATKARDRTARSWSRSVAFAAFLLVLGLAPATYAAELPQEFNHSFDVDAATAIACTDGAVFTGEPTAASSLNIAMTAQVWDGTGTALLATGDTHTFTAIGEPYTFTVPGTFAAGDLVLLQANNTPGTFPSTQGDAATATVANCSITPGFSKSFSPNPIDPGDVSTLTFSIENSIGATVGNLDFSDRLPANVLIATPANAATTCTGGSLSAPAGGDTIAYSGGTVGASSTCTVSVDVTSDTPGTYTNTSGDLTSDAGNSGSASDDLVVNPIAVPLAPGAGLLLFALLLLAGGAVLAARRNKAFSFRGGALPLVLLAVAVAVTAAVGAAPAGASVASPPGFGKAFMPSTVGPGSTTMLIFTINNSDNPMYPVGDLAFDDELPFGLALAAPSFVSNDCGGTVTLDDDDADSGFDIRLTGGMLAPGASCTIVVNVTGSSPGEVAFVNTSGDLTSNAGNSGPAVAELTITGALPGFTKAFDPAMVPFGGRSTLTFTIDNTANGSDVEDLLFTDPLPPGMVVAEPANASTNCGDPLIPAELTADPGTSVIELDSAGVVSFPSLDAGMICTVEVDVIGGAVGALGNLSGELSATIGTVKSAGKAAAVLEVDGYTSLLALTKTFIDDPVPPGGTVTLQFTVTNRSRDDASTGITFSDTIDPMGGLTGLVPAEALPKAACGGTVDLVGSDLVLTGGSLPAAGSCTFSVALSVPTGATPGTYTNTTSMISGDVGGSPQTGDGATDQLFVVDFPLLTKTFTDDPVGAGGVVTLEYTITNTSTSALIDIAFEDIFDQIIKTSPSGAPAGGSCGTGSMFTFFNFIDGGMGSSNSPARLFVSKAKLAPKGMAGDSCTFSLTLMIEPGAAAGIYPNVTSPITAKLDDVAGDPTVTGPPGTDDLELVGAPQLSKEFTDDPVVPGGTVTLKFTLENFDDTNAASAIAFDDDLDDTLTGLTLTSVLTDTCSGTVTGVGTGLFEYSGGSLAAADGDEDPPEDDTCTIELELLVPGSPPGGTFPNETSELTAMVAGLPVTAAKATDDLVVAGLQFSKAFSGDPVIPGGTATLTFTLDNSAGTSPDDDATSIFFIDDLDANLPGLAATTTPASPIPGCGGSSSLTPSDGGTYLTFSGGAVAGGTVCSFSVTVTVPATADFGGGPEPVPDDFYLNVTSSLFATIDSTSVILPPAADEIEVNSTLLEITKEFLGDPVASGGSVTLQLTLTNLSTTETVTDIGFSDDLDAALSGLEATGAGLNECGGMATSGFPTGLFTYAGGTLDPDTSCTITLAVDVPDAPLLDAPPFINTTSGVTGKVGALDVYGDPDEDELLVQVLFLSKDFTDDPTTATGTVTLEFTLTNLGAATATDLSFLDNLSAVIPGLVATTLPPVGICGAGSTLTGTSTLSFTGGSLAGDSSCVIPVTLTVPASATAGTFLNATSALRAQSQVAAAGATASLVIEPPPTFAKVFAPDSIGLGQTSTLTFTIDNSASAVAANSLAFTDTLPAGIAVTAPPVTSNDCGGTLTAAGGSNSISLSGGSVAASATCQIMVSVTGVAVGVHVNTTGDLTSSSGNSGTASDTLTVNPQPGFAKMFAPDPITVGGTSTLTFTIDNTGSTVAASSLAFSDSLPAAILVATPPNASTTCTGGTLAAVAGSGSISYSGGSVAAGASCTVKVDVTSSTPGTHTNTSGDLTSSLGNSGTASDSLTVNPPPGFAKVFSPDPILVGGTSTLTFTITNTGSTVAAASLDFTDNLPAAITVASTPNASTTCTGGTLTAAAGSGLISYSGGSVAAGSSCTIEVDVTSSTPGVHTNTSGDLTSSLGNSGTASDSLTVNPPPGFAKVFAPNPIVVGGTSTLTFTITNTGSTVAAASLDFTDNLPAAITVASPPGASTTCTGGTLTAVAGSGSISYSGGSVAAGASCTVEVDVTSSIPGTYTNTSGDLTSSLGNSGTASDSLTVNAIPPVFTKSFSPDPVGETLVTTLTFTIDNTASSVAAADLDFLDLLPFDLQVASPPMVVNDCGGSVSAAAASTSISLSNGSVGAGATCEIAVKILAPSPRVVTNTTGDLTSSTGNSGQATDMLTVEACASPDGANLTLGNRVVLVSETREACNTITVQEHVQVLGPNGRLTLRAGVAVVIFDGFSIEQNGELVIEIDASLTMP